jgi:hypothetical protein
VSDAGEGREIEEHATEDRHRRPAHTAASPGGGHRNTVLIAPAEHLCDLLGGGGPGDEGCTPRDLTGQ